MATPLENPEAWARMALCLDPTQDHAKVYELLSHVPTYQDYPSDVYLPDGPFSEEDVASLFESHPVLAEFYEAEAMLDILNTFQGDNAYVAAAANPSLPIKKYFFWAGDTYLHNVRIRETGDNLFWRCNLAAGTPEAISELQNQIGSIAQPDYCPILLHRWLKNLEDYFFSPVRMEVAYPLLKEASEAVTGRPDMLSQDDIFVGHVLGRFYLAEIFANMIRIRLRSGEGELSSMAALIHDLEQVRTRLDGPPLPNPFVRIF